MRARPLRGASPLKASPWVLLAAALAAAPALALPAVTVALSSSRSLPTCGRPSDVLAHVTPMGVFLGEEQPTPAPLRFFGAGEPVTRELKRLKDARPERQALVIRADDDVSVDELVWLVDLGKGFDYGAQQLIVDRRQGARDRSLWRSPHMQELIACREGRGSCAEE